MKLPYSVIFPRSSVLADAILVVGCVYVGSPVVCVERVCVCGWSVAALCFVAVWCGKWEILDCSKTYTYSYARVVRSASVGTAGSVEQAK